MGSGDVDLLWPEYRSRGQLVGVTGDITDVVLVLLSLLARDYGITFLRTQQYYDVFSEFWEQHPGLITKIKTGGCSRSFYKYRLAFALEAAFSLGVEGVAKGIRIPDPERVLQHVERRAGPEFIEHFRHATKELFDLLC